MGDVNNNISHSHIFTDTVFEFSETVRALCGTNTAEVGATNGIRTDEFAINNLFFNNLIFQYNTYLWELV